MSLLEQLSSASLQHHHQHHQDGSPADLLEQLAACIAAIHARHTTSPDAASAQLLQDVQAGLSSSAKQLERLLAGREPPPPAEATTTTNDHKRPPSLAVLQQLLQLAVGDSSSSMTAQQQQRQQQPALQQQRWHSAACEAVQLFSLAELVQLPAHSLQQALLLHPTLLDQLLEAAAAAVLQPVLLHPAAPAGHAHAGDAGDGSSSSSTHNMQSLLAGSCPWMLWLPELLAHQPALMLRTYTTLLSWLEASGHNRLWQLLSSTCRPAWQQLTAAAAAADAQCSNATSSSSSSAAGSPQQLVLSGAFQLLCPQPWQQQLVAVLAEEPSLLGLVRLLQQLPGVAWPTQQQQQQQQQRTDASGAAGMDTDAPGADLWGSEALGCWPGAQEWGQARPCSGPAAAAAAAAAATAATASQAAAWGLVMHHHCWSQYACALLVRCSLSHLQQQQSSRGSWSMGLQQVVQLQTQTQQQLLELSAAQQAACAALFLAWLQQPFDCNRQVCLQQQLMSAAAVAPNAPSQQQGGLIQAARSLLHAWKATQQQQQHAGESGATGSWGCASPSLLTRDLPCAVLQQRRLLVGCIPEQLVPLCLDAMGVSSSADATSQQPPQQQQETNSHGCASSAPDLQHARSAISQLLDCSNSVCAAALEVVNASMRHRLQQQQQPLHGVHDVSWLAREWLADAASSGPKGLAVPDLAAAKHLLAAATGVDQQLKASCAAAAACL